MTGSLPLRSPLAQHLSAPADSPPKPLYAHARPDGWVDITWALPGLRTAVVASPAHHLDPGHRHLAGRALAELALELDRQDLAQARKIPGA